MSTEMNLVIRKATRQGIVPLIGINGKSGTGKTKSALLLMRGIIGPSKRLGCIDTEFRRSEEYANEIPGGFEVIQLDPPYSPERYREALELAAKEWNGVVVDSISHEWTGEGGVLESVDAWLDEKCGDDYKKRDKMKISAWNSKSPRNHAALLAYMVRYPIPLILCFRAKDKIHIEKNEDQSNAQGGYGKPKTSITTEIDCPVQRGDLIWEMKLVLETIKRDENGSDMGGGYYTVRKRGLGDVCNAILACGDRISVNHGEAISKLYSSSQTTQTRTQSAPVDELKAAKGKMWAMTKPIHGGKKEALESWLIHLNLIPAGTTLDQLTLLDIETLIPQIENSLPKE